MPIDGDGMMMEHDGGWVGRHYGFEKGFDQFQYRVRNVHPNIGMANGSHFLTLARRVQEDSDSSVQCAVHT